MRKLFSLFIILAAAVTASQAQVIVKITAGGPVTFCPGGNVVLTGNITPPGTYTYQWVRNANNIGGATNISYTASVSASYYLKVTDSVSTVYYSDTIVVTVSPLPPKPGIKFNSPALLCSGNPVMLTDTSSVNTSFQWLRNGSPLSGAVTGSFTAADTGLYRLIVTNLTTTCRDTSENIAVGKLPYIAEDTIHFCGDSAVISLAKGYMSFSVLPAVCNADMRLATLVTGTATGGGGATKLICTGGSNTVNGSGSGKYFVVDGGSLAGFGGGGSNTAWVKAGGFFL